MALPPDILNEDCSDLLKWVNLSSGNATVVVSPVGNFRFDTEDSSVYDYIAQVDLLAGIVLPDEFTIKAVTYFDAIGSFINRDSFIIYLSNSTWAIIISFGTDGLKIRKSGVWGLVGGIVLTGVWQTWRFEINKTVESSATVEVFLGALSQGVFDCDYTGSHSAILRLEQDGQKNNDRVSHIDSIKIATGLGDIAESVSLSDSIHVADSIYLSIAQRAIFDSIHVVDNFKKFTPRIRVASGINLVDQFTRVATQYRNFSEIFYFNDSLNKKSIVAISDTISVLDFFDKYTPAPAITDFIRIEDDVHVWNQSMYKNDAFLANDSFSKWKTPVLLYIEIINAPGSMIVGEAQQLIAIGFYDDDSQAVLTKLVTWVSSNQNVATIDSTGLVIIPVAQGSTFITAYLDTVYGRIEKTIMVRVGLGDEVVSKLTEADISNLQLIPLDPSPNQTFGVVLTVDGRNINLQIKLRWNILAQYWVMTIIDPGIGDYLVDGIVITTGVLPTINILQPYSYLGIGSCYIINVSGVDGDYPDEFNLGTDYVMLWGNTEV